MPYRRVSDIKDEPVSIELLKAFLTDVPAADEALLQAFLRRARRKMEEMSGQVLCVYSATSYETWEAIWAVEDWDKAFSEFGYVTLPILPFHAVTSIKERRQTVATDATVATTVYYADTSLGRITLMEDMWWPHAENGHTDALSYIVTYTAGQPYLLPDWVEDGLLRVVGWMYENRGNGVTDGDLAKQIALLCPDCVRYHFA